MTANVIVVSQKNDAFFFVLLTQPCQRAFLPHCSKTSSYVSTKTLKCPCLSKDSIKSIFCIMFCDSMKPIFILLTCFRLSSYLNSYQITCFQRKCFLLPKTRKMLTTCFLPILIFFFNSCYYGFNCYHELYVLSFESY